MDWRHTHPHSNQQHDPQHNQRHNQQHYPQHYPQHNQLHYPQHYKWFQHTSTTTRSTTPATTRRTTSTRERCRHRHRASSGLAWRSVCRPHHRQFRHRRSRWRGGRSTASCTLSPWCRAQRSTRRSTWRLDQISHKVDHKALRWSSSGGRHPSLELGTVAGVSTFRAHFS